MEDFDYKDLYTKLVLKFDSSQIENAKLRQKIIMHTVEPSTIREEKAWDAGFIAHKDGLTSADNPYTIERELAEGKKKHFKSGV